MPQDIVTCPSCGASFPLTDVLREQLEAKVRLELQDKLSRREKDLAVRENAAQAREDSFDERVKQQVRKESEKLRQKLREEVEEEAASESKEKDEKYKRLEKRLKDSQKAESELREMTDKLDAEKQDLELTVNRRVDQEKATIQKEEREKAAEQLKLKDVEHGEKIRELREKLEAAQQSASQGSQQLQGEAFEIALEQDLSSAFTHDKIEPVPKGKVGADILQRVCHSSGVPSGTIIWETKRTKSWSNGWVTKIKDDQRHSTADVAVIVTQALPEGVRSFDVLEGVVVTDYAHALPLAALLRERLFEVDRTRRSEVGRAKKESLVYDYLNSTEFRQAGQTIAEAIFLARDDIRKERATFERMWSKREAQLEIGLRNLLAMWGKIQGLIGSLPNLSTIAALEGDGVVPSLPPGSSKQQRKFD